MIENILNSEKSFEQVKERGRLYYCHQQNKQWYHCQKWQISKSLYVYRVILKMVPIRIIIRVSMVVFEVIQTGLSFGIHVNTNLVYQYRTSLQLRE